ncbi:ParB N-terminal domain-containing protein [Nocardioides sp.]|uniref:ParB/RepB/Spo0J family partition protein n=1 Tax=Nocardioides sp. TaxID=35761 RepID=UPI00261A3D00|nr:ParB N-terminal domain-containing protein [Nocardioides sp.]MDI6911463.1 ParB N-terminal domain-containing protein [Nocardioides sp.]
MTTTNAIEPGTTVHVPPGTLLLERNIRDAQPDPDLVASVRAVGVLQPITARVAQDGRLVVRMGFRRTLAAIEAGRDSVPVYVAGHVDDTDADEIDRIITQRDENTHRAGLTAGEEIGVVEQLAAFGLSADEIAAQARMAKDKVETATRVSGSKLARKAAAKYEALTLDQAAVVAEFEDDTETAKTLIVTAIEQPGQFAHTVQRARDERLIDRLSAALIADLEQAGVPVVKHPNYDDKTKPLDRLRNDKGKEITAAAHKTCPGHVAWLTTSWKWVDADGNPCQGNERPPGSRNLQVPRVVYGCKDPKKHGHTDSWASSSGSRPAADDMTPEQREKARKERALVIENNKAWDSAEAVRRDWIGSSLAKLKTPPRGTGAFIARTLSEDRYVLTHEGNQTSREQLCTTWGLPMKAHGYGHRVEIPKGTTENRALVIALVQIIAAHEASTDRMSWRRDGTKNRHGYYLRFLQSAGYGLSDVEKYAISSKTA